MALVEKAEVVIAKLNDDGLGEGYTDMGAVRLPYVLPGDVAEFERHAYRGQSNTILKSILHKAAEHKIPECKYYGICGGCLLQHLPDEEYLKFKYNLVQKFFDNKSLIKPMMIIEFGNRRRANLEAVKKNGQLFLGFHRFHSHQIVNIDSCPALLPELSNLLAPLKNTLIDVMEDREKLVLFITKSALGIDISIEIHNKKALEPKKRDMLKAFAIDNGVTRLIFRYRKIIDLIHGSQIPYVLFDGVKVEIDSHAFLQSSDLSDKILSDLVVKYLGYEKAGSFQEENILDLFCGRGTYTIPLSKYSKVDGYESDSKALKALADAANQNNLPISLYKRDLFGDPVLAQDMAQYSKIVINPPRSGAESQIKEIAKSKVTKICYVSCNPETFARDANILTNSGYKLLEITPVDQFYYSPHLEVVGYFEKAENL